MAKKNKMLERIKNQPSSVNLSSRIVTAQPSKIISKEYANLPLEKALGATEIDENIDLIEEFLKEDLPSAKLPKSNEVYDKFGKLVKLGKPALGALKIASKVAVPLGVAADVLASEDIASGEMKEIEQEKLKNQKLKEFLKNPEKIKEFKKKEIELSQKPIHPADLLKKPDSSQIDEELNYKELLKKRKKMMGYE